jgi:hypothetical protein
MMSFEQPVSSSEGQFARPAFNGSAEPNGTAEKGQTAGEVLRPEETHAGRLFGWLVSYATPKGVATELREGKFFVSRTSLKENDLIINDESVSTPHAMITVSQDTGLQIQDLMSACGFFVKKRGTDSFQREYYTTVIEHGDWIRFGGVEYLVSLISHVGVK